MKNDMILITGATGFIGTHLATALVEKGKKVRCLVRRSSPEAATVYLRSIGAELAQGDLTDSESLREALKGIETVFHVGGGGRLGMSEDICYAINVIGTKNILDACIEHGAAKKFVYVSTCGVMGNIKNPPADETYPYNPEPMAYARAKARAEKLVLSYRDKLPVVVVRFPGVYGQPLVAGELNRVEGVTPMSMIFSTVKQGQWVYIGDGKVLTHWVHVDDVARGIELAAEKGKAGEVYILADKKPVTMIELVELISALLKVCAPRRHIPVPVAFLLASFFELTARLSRRSPRMTRDLVRGFIANRAYDISKARRELEYVPTISLEEGMKQTLRWYQTKAYV